MLRRGFLLFVILTSLAACGAEPIWSEQHELDRVAYRAPGPAKLTLITVINNRSGSGGHTGLLINGPQRVVWDPAGTWWDPNAPERNDLHYGMTDRMVDIYVDYHTRETYHTVLQEITVTPEVAAQAMQLAANYGAAGKTQCSYATSQILSQLQGFESIPVGYFPTKTMDAFAKLPGVVTRKVYDDDADDNSGLLPAG